MSTVLIVVLVVAVVALIGLAVVLGRRAQAHRQLERERLAQQADAHRDEAQAHASKAGTYSDHAR
jgi:type II secretory pathway pseudopilin PulG